MSASRVVVLGSGFAGLETAFLLRSRVGADKAEIILVSDRDEFLFKPAGVYLPFGGAEWPMHSPLTKGLRRRGIEQRIATVQGVDTKRGVVETTGGPVGYDRLVIATGASMRPDEIPGLAEYGRQVWTPAQLHQLGEDLQWVVQNARHGRPQRVVFVVPPNNKCAGPLYELVFMLDTWLRRREVRHQVEIEFTTTEHTFIQAFGPKLHEVVQREFKIRYITGHTGVDAEKVTENEITYTDGSAREFDVLVAFPPYAAAIDYDGLPRDDRGFLTCDPGTRTIDGFPEIFAPGDAGDFPVKQAFLALQQADAVAGTIAMELGSQVELTAFEPVSMCVMEMFDKATFAQVPLTLTGEPASPIAVDIDDPAYRVGTNPLWRLGKKTLGFYVPTWFRMGLPVHSGPAWRAMELGLGAGSRVLAK